MTSAEKRELLLMTSQLANVISSIQHWSVFKGVICFFFGEQVKFLPVRRASLRQGDVRSA